MDSYRANLMPLKVTYDDDLIRLLSKANEKYTEYKVKLSNLKFNSLFFLKSLIKTESLMSSRIEGTNTEINDLYYLDYLEFNDDNKEIMNLEKLLLDITNNINSKNDFKINIESVCNMHKILLESTRGSNKKPGEIRTVQNWIGPKGCDIEHATFVPPNPEEVVMLLENLFDFCTDDYCYADAFINVAISHAQFETIHPYHDGNGRIGRALIPIELALLKGDGLLLFLSEVFEIYKPSYQNALMDYRNGRVLEYLKFFINCIVEQCNSFIYKLDTIISYYEKDYNLILEQGNNTLLKMMPSLVKNIVFTKSDIQKDLDEHINTISRNLKTLIDLGILTSEKRGRNVVYRYEKIYNIFINDYN